MTLRWYYAVDDTPTVLEITGRVNWPDIAVGANAEEGSGWVGQLAVNDPAGDLIMLVYRRIWAIEDSAPSGEQRVGNWFITDLDVIRDNPRVLASRRWLVTMADPNCLLERLIMVGSDGVRPAETDIARVRWLLTTTELSFLDPDETYIDTTGPVNMPANDFIGQRPSEILSDCSQQSKKNYWVMFNEDVGDFVLAYFDPNVSDLYQSDLSLTNVESEVDIPGGVYPIAADTRLTRLGGRVASGEYLTGSFPEKYVYGVNTATRTLYGPHDVSAPAINLKTAAQATARLNQHLAQMTEPDDEVVTAIVVEEADLNRAMPGMQIPLHATHLPNYTATEDRPAYATGADMRIKKRDVVQVGPTTFRVGLTLSPKPSPVPSWCVITWPEGYEMESSGRLPFKHSGDNPGTGDMPPATVASYGLLTKIGTLASGDSSRFTGILIGGAGSVDCFFHTDFNWTHSSDPGDNACTWAIFKNGVQVGGTNVVDMGSGAHAWVPLGVDATCTIDVVAGDIIDARMLFTGPGTPPTSFFALPAGTGDGFNQLSVTGDLV